MFYQLHELQRAALGPLLGAMRMPDAAAGLQRLAFALGEVVARSLDAGEATTAPIEAAVSADLGGPLTARVVAETPFVRIVALRAARRPRRRILLVAPHSGYAAASAVRLVLALLECGEVWVTDWTDARLVPGDAGGFGLEDQVALTRHLLAIDGGPAHLVGLSQSVPLALAAAAIAAPTSLVLPGGPADPTRSPSPLQQTLAMIPRARLQQQALSAVPARYPGAGRRVFPSVYQLITYAATAPGSYRDVQGGLLRELAGGGTDGCARQHADLHRLLDVPAEIFLDSVEHAVRTPVPLAQWRSARCLALLTVEAGADSLVGPGQTHAAHERLGIDGLRQTIAGAEHHDLLVGQRFAREVAPTLAGFYAALAG